MRQTLIAMLALLVLCPVLSARDVHDWQNVTKLKRGTCVLIELRNGTAMTGEIEEVSARDVQIAVRDSDNDYAAWLRTIDRASILRIVREPGRLYLPDPHRWMIVGLAAGGTTGLVSGAISDARNGNSGRWLVEGAAGSFAGALMGLAAAGCVGIAQIPRALLRRKTIFKAPGGGHASHLAK